MSVLSLFRQGSKWNNKDWKNLVFKSVDPHRKLHKKEQMWNFENGEINNPKLAQMSEDLFKKGCYV